MDIALNKFDLIDRLEALRISEEEEISDFRIMYGNEMLDDCLDIVWKWFLENE